MFLLNSCLGLFSAASSQRRPFSRSYGAILPSSLAMLPPPALGFSPFPPVSVCGTGVRTAIAAFLGTGSACSATFSSLLLTALHWTPVFPCALLLRFYRYFLSRLMLPPCVPAVLDPHSTGISTCCPSATPFGLALGPDLPRADQLYPGNLGYSAGRIPTFLSLLIPAFSLPGTPLPLAVQLLRAGIAPLPCRPSGLHPGLRRRVSAPDIFGAGPLG